MLHKKQEMVQYQATPLSQRRKQKTAKKQR